MSAEDMTGETGSRSEAGGDLGVEASAGEGEEVGVVQCTEETSEETEATRQREEAAADTRCRRHRRE